LSAGHCVSTGSGTFYQNVAFCPSYVNGTCNTLWVAKNLLTFSEYHTRRDFGRDVSFIVSYQTQGKNLSEITGFLPLYQNISLYNVVSAVGYPVKNWGGERLVQTVAVMDSVDTNYSPNTKGITTT
jgi:hypothetical protein